MSDIFNLSDWQKYNASSNNGTLDTEYLDTLFVTESELQQKLTRSELDVNSIKFLSNPSTIQFLDNSIQSSGFTNIHKQNLETISTQYTNGNIGLLDKTNIYTKPITCNDSISVKNGSSSVTLTKGSSLALLSTSTNNDKIVIQTLDNNSVNKQFQFLPDGTMVVPDSLQINTSTITSDSTQVSIDNELQCEDSLHITNNGTTLSLSKQSTQGILSNDNKIVIQPNSNKNFEFTTDGRLVIPNAIKFGTNSSEQTEPFSNTFRDDIISSKTKLANTTKGSNNEFIVSSVLEANELKSVNDISLLAANKGIRFGDNTYQTTAAYNSNLPIVVSTDTVTGKKILTIEEESTILCNSGIIKTRQVEVSSNIKFGDTLQGKAYSDVKDQINTYKTWIKYNLQQSVSGGNGSFALSQILPTNTSLQVSDTTPKILKDCMYVFTLRVRVYAINRLTMLNFDYVRLYSYLQNVNPPSQTSDSRYLMSSNFSIINTASTFVFNSATSYSEWEKNFYFRAGQTTTADIILSIGALYNITTLNSTTNLIFSFDGNLVQL